MKKNKLILLQVFIAFVLICTSVYATVSTTIGISASTTTVDKGEKITVTLSLKDVDSTKKVESIEGYINYNTNIIEPINIDSIQKNADNTIKIGNEVLNVEDLTNVNVNELSSSTAYVAFNGSPASGNNSKIVIDFKDGIISDTNLLTIEFKVKSDATEGEIKNAISYSMFVVTAGSEQSEEITKNIDLTVKTVGNSNQDNTNTDNNTNTNTDNENRNTNNNTNTNTKNENKNTNNNTNTGNTNRNTNNKTNTGNKANTAVDNTVSGKLPATGAKIVVIPGIVLAIIAYICYNRYIKYKDI